ncbi:AraC family transcriptional regulator [Actinomycetospora sp. C-140]
MRRFDVASSDPEVADRWLQDTYVNYRRRLHGDPSAFSFTFTGAAAPRYSIATLHHSLGFETRTELLGDAVILNTTVSGRVAISAGRTTVEPGPGEPYLMPPGHPWSIRWDDLTNRAVCLAHPVLRRAAADLGWDGGEVRFTGYRPASPGLGRYLELEVAHVRDDVLAAEDIASSPLLLDQAGRTLAGAILAAFPNTACAAIGERARRPDGGEPAVVRRAVEYIEANAHRDIGTSDIAREVRIGPRGLQQAFQRHRGQTPMNFLRSVRMERAHRELETADPTRGDTVGAIVARWGFSNAGRFAAAYRRVYGRTPQATLRS